MEHIKELMKSGDVKGAAEDLKKLLVAEPENVEAKMLYGTCCHLLGDDKTFCSIHDELAPKMEAEKDEKKISLWKKYHLMWEYVIVAALVFVGVSVCALYFGKSVMNIDIPVQVVPARDHGSLYGGPGYDETKRITEARITDADSFQKFEAYTDEHECSK